MRLMIIAAGAALTLAACNRHDAQNNVVGAAGDTNMMMTDSNLTLDQNMSGNAGMTDANGAMGAGGADANAATNAASENALKQKDLNTHDRDTNLANGL